MLPRALIQTHRNLVLKPSTQALLQRPPTLRSVHIFRHCSKLANRRFTASNPIQAAMDQDIEMTVEKIHSTQAKIVMFITGGAAQAPGWLLSVPGASRTILDVQIPYATSAQTQLLGYKPTASATAEISVDLAKAAYRQAALLATIGTPIIGVGATCALSTDRDRRGENKAFVTTHTGTTTKTYSLKLAKGARRRQEEDGVASRLVVKAVADVMGVGNNFAVASGLTAVIPPPVGGSGGTTTNTNKEASTSNQDDDGNNNDVDSLQVSQVYSQDDTKELIKELLHGNIKALEFSGGGGAAVVVDAPRGNRIYLPGSFNPLHDGHRKLLEAACRAKPGMEGCYELSVGNADKGRLPIEEIERRVNQFTAAQLPVVLTQAPLFTMKADMFPKSLFVVGYDTAQRLVQEKYYGTETAMLLQFAKLHHEGCSFLVGGRADGDSGRFLELKDLEVPEVLQRGGLFEGIGESEFRMDISSTELRQKVAGATPV